MRIPEDDPSVLSLVASSDPDDPVYFWQLHSMLGEHRLRCLIQTFYELVFADETEFGKAFSELGSIAYHVERQLLFWLDATGGGKTYTGGLVKLKAKHGVSSEIMHEEGSRRWIFHFVRALRRSDLGTEPVRVLACVLDFLCFFMQKYAVEFDFNFADSILIDLFRSCKL
jgi:truncated hemoglobin YjbI